VGIEDYAGAPDSRVKKGGMELSGWEIGYLAWLATEGVGDE